MAKIRTKNDTTQDYSKLPWKAIRAKAVRYARRRGAVEFSEDFAQFYCMARLRGRKATLKDLFTDFMRVNFGDTRSEYGKQKAMAKLQYEELTIPYERFADLDIESFRDWTSEDFFQETFAFLAEKDKTLLRYYRDGYTCAEIGKKLGVSATTISQRFKLVKIKIKRHLGDSALGLYPIRGKLKDAK